MSGSIDGSFLSWSVDLQKNLLNLHPLPEGLSPIPLDVLLPPKHTLELMGDIPKPNRTIPVVTEMATVEDGAVTANSQNLSVRPEIPTTPTPNGEEKVKMVYVPPLEHD